MIPLCSRLLLCILYLGPLYACRRWPDAGSGEAGRGVLRRPMFRSRVSVQVIFPKVLVLCQFGKPTRVSTVVRWVDLCRTSLDFAPTAGCWAREGGYHHFHAQLPSGLCPFDFYRGAVPKTGVCSLLPANMGAWGQTIPGQVFAGDIAVPGLPEAALARKGRRPVPERIGVRQGFPIYQGSVNGTVNLARMSLPRWSRNRVGRDARLEPLRVA